MRSLNDWMEALEKLLFRIRHILTFVHHLYSFIVIPFDFCLQKVKNIEPPKNISKLNFKLLNLAGRSISVICGFYDWKRIILIEKLQISQKSVMENSLKWLKPGLRNSSLFLLRFSEMIWVVNIVRLFQMVYILNRGLSKHWTWNNLIMFRSCLDFKLLIIIKKFLSSYPVLRLT